MTDLRERGSVVPPGLSPEDAARVERCKLAFELSGRLDLDRQVATKLADRINFVEWLRKREGKA